MKKFWFLVLWFGGLFGTGQLVVGTNAEYPPFTFLEKGEIVGFDIDVAKEVGKRLEKKIVFKDMPFDALIPTLKMKRLDFVAAGLTATKERAKRVVFTNPYLPGDGLMIVSKLDQRVETLSDVKGGVVLVNEGYTADVYLSNQVGLNVIRLGNPADCFAALECGRGVAFVTAKLTVEDYLKRNGGKKLHVVPIPKTGDGCSLAVKPGDQALLMEIQGALDAIEKDGTMETLKKRWAVQ